MPYPKNFDVIIWIKRRYFLSVAQFSVKNLWLKALNNHKLSENCCKNKNTIISCLADVCQLFISRDLDGPIINCPQSDNLATGG